MQNEALLDFDVPYAFLNRKSRLHEMAKEIFSKIQRCELNPAFSTLGFIELEVVYRSLGRSDSEIVEDCSAFSAMNLEILPLSVEVVITAAQLREAYELPFWDSHYAAHALIENRALVSTDAAFDKVEDLERVKPEELAGY